MNTILMLSFVLGGGSTDAVAELGRMLYHDSRVSAPNLTSCASCHQLENGTADGLQRAVGLIGLPGSPTGLIGPRKTMPTLNAGHIDEFVDHYNEPKFWDGRAKNLEDQATGPVENPDEMGNQTKQEVVRRISAIPGYRPYILAAFPNSGGVLDVRGFQIAIAQFQQKFLTAVDTPAYRYLYKQEQDAISEEEKPGALIFYKNCLTCHSGKTFTTGRFANNGSEYVRPSNPMDRGLAKTTGNSEHEGMFKIPTLVAIQIRKPYFHNAFARDLKRVIAHYAGGGTYRSPTTSKPERDPRTDPRVKRIRLDATEQAQLLVFMSNAFRAYDMPKKENVVPRKLP